MFESTIISGQVYLGKQGEHCARRFSFHDVDIWKQKFGEGRCELLHQRNGEDAPYPVVLTVEDGVPYWCVSEVDTAIAGLGKCEIRYIVDDAVVKSNIYTTFVQEALGEGAEEPPEAAQPWVDQVLDAAEKVEGATTHQPIIGDNGNWFVWDAETEKYKDSGTPAKSEVDYRIVNNNVANALKGSASGETLYIDDISPLTHELNVKLSSKSITDFSKVRLRAFKTKGKNLFDVSKIITTASLKDPNVVQLTNNNDGSLTVSTYGISSIIRYDDGTWRYVTLREIAPLLEVGKSYYMSANTNGKNFITLCCYDEDYPETDYTKCLAHWFFDSRGLVVNNVNNYPITDELLDCGVFFYNNYHNGVDEATISDIQIELITNEEHIGKSGYSPTKYEPYQNDFAEYNANIDGTVEGVISAQPTMYIETDTEDVYISVTYNKDSNGVVEKIYADTDAEIKKKADKDYVDSVREDVSDKLKESDIKLEEKVDKEFVNNNFVGRLKGNASRRDCITISDIAEPEHNVKVKVSSDTIADLTSIKLTRCGKNAFDVSKVKSLTNTKLINNGDGSLTVSGYGQIAGTLENIAPLIQVGKVYRLSMKTNGKKFIVLGGYTWFPDSRGLCKGAETNIPIQKELLTERVLLYNDGGSTVCTISDIQIELNDAENPQEFVATEYEPFNHDIEEYTPNADGTVEGVRSLYPTTVIYSDKEGIEITADYNRDINKVITELTQAIISLGGTI